MFDVHETTRRLNADFFGTLRTLSASQMAEVLRYAGDRFYNHGESTFSDEDYDRLREHYGATPGADAQAVVAPHTRCAKVGKSKVRLPHFLASMDKIKPDTHNLDRWRAKFAGRVCISDKLDGISGLVVKTGAGRSLYTRGDGSVGQDISHMLPVIQIGEFPDLAEYVVRGELIVRKDDYERVKDGKRGARPMVSGATSQRTLTAERTAEMALIAFVAYEVIEPSGLPPSEQFALLQRRSSFAVAEWSVESDVCIDRLCALLSARKPASPYEMDGLIVNHDAPHPRAVGQNPDHAFAFKMAFAEQSAVSRVVAVNWEASKDGFLKPTVHFEPVVIGGVTIQYATGFNAAFIEANGLGPGAFIEVIRSGDVIPYIQRVRMPAPDGPSMPASAWHWNETRVDALLDCTEGNADVQKKALHFFANALHIDFCGEATIARLHDAGIDTIPKLVRLTEAQLLERVRGFQAASAAKLVAAIARATTEATMVQWAVGSGVFGRGIGAKRLEAALSVVSVVSESLHVDAGLEGRIVALGGWSSASAAGFVEALPAFQRLMETVGIAPPVAAPTVELGASAPDAAIGKLAGQVVLFTGFHPKDLAAAVVAHGGRLVESWSKSVTHLVVKDAAVVNEKTKKARTAGVSVVTADELQTTLAQIAHARS